MDLESLQFIVRFSEMKLDELDARGWLNLRNEIAVFGLDTFQRIDQKLSGPGGFDRRTRLPHEETKAAIESVQKDVHKVMYALVEVRELFQGKQQEITLPPIKLSPDCSFHLSPFTSPDHNILHMLGPERDVFLFSLLSMLPNLPRDILQRCPECPKIFVRVRKQRYCSRQCVNRVNARKWRNTAEGKRKNRERAAEGYQKRRARVRAKRKNAD